MRISWSVESLVEPNLTIGYIEQDFHNSGSKRMHVIRGFDNIEIQFSNFNLYNNETKRDEIVSLITDIINSFESPVQFSKKIMIYFGWKSERTLHALGRTYIYNVEAHQDLIRHEFSEVYDRLQPFEFYILIAPEIYEHEDRVFRTFTLAHEFQHVVQYLISRCHVLIGRVLFEYFWLKKNDNLAFKRIPYEFDARRMAKLIAYKMHTKTKVDQYLENIISSGQEDEKNECQFLKDIDIGLKYDLIAEYDKSWRQHRKSICLQIEDIKGQAPKTYDENNLLLAYEYLMHEFPDMDCLIGE